MKKIELKRIIGQIKKYKLENCFESTDDFELWVSGLNNRQISNFINLDMLPDEINFPSEMLLDACLLNCDDYSKRIEALSKLKNGEGCLHLFSKLCYPEFVNSENFYKDIELLSTAQTAKYGLWVIANDDFINSPYHDEDLKLIVEAKDVSDKKNDFVISECLATIACNRASINSPYHEMDMKLISQTGSNLLQSINSFPKYSISHLACNEYSLKDKYHLENMRMLSINDESKIKRIFLYNIMTNPMIICSDNYRNEVLAILNAKSDVSALALYNYIVNPKKSFYHDMRMLFSNFLYEDVDIPYDYIEEDELSCGKNCSFSSNDYLKNLRRINEVDDKYILWYVSLLMNRDFMVSNPYHEQDLKLLLDTTANINLFKDIYTLIKNPRFYNSPYHTIDASLIRDTIYNSTRELLINIATNFDNISSNNHVFDMDLIRRQDIENFDNDLLDKIGYYLFSRKGLNDCNHQAILINLCNSVLVDKKMQLKNYFDFLESQIVDNSQIEIMKEGVERSLGISYDEYEKLDDSSRKDLIKKKTGKNIDNGYYIEIDDMEEENEKNSALESSNLPKKILKKVFDKVKR